MQRTHNISIDFGNGVITGPDTDFALLGYDGLTNMSTDATISEYSSAAGGTVKSIRPKTRILSFEIENPNISWSELCALFPIGLYRLSITRDGVTRIIDAYRYEELEQLGDGGALDPAGIQVSFVAEFPFFRQADLSEVAIFGLSEGGVSWPFKYPIMFDTWTTSTGVLEVVNAGSYATPFVLRITPSQDISSISLLINHKSMEIVGEISSGQELIVDTGNYKATLDGENVFSFIKGWPQLEPGLNHISISELVGNISMIYEPLFEGV